MIRPTAERIKELLVLFKEEAPFRGEDYTDWDDLIECSKKLTFEEWRWCERNFEVKIYADVRYTEGLD